MRSNPCVWRNGDSLLRLVDAGAAVQNGNAPRSPPFESTTRSHRRESIAARPRAAWHPAPRNDAGRIREKHFAADADAASALSRLAPLHARRVWVLGPFVSECRTASDPRKARARPRPLIVSGPGSSCINSEVTQQPCQSARCFAAQPDETTAFYARFGANPGCPVSDLRRPPSPSGRVSNDPSCQDQIKEWASFRPLVALVSKPRRATMSVKKW